MDCTVCLHDVSKIEINTLLMPLKFKVDSSNTHQIDKAGKVQLSRMGQYTIGT